jgi:hypothetical protein
MMLTPDEYMAIMRLLESTRESEGASLALRERGDSSASPPPRKRKKSKYNREFGRQLKNLKVKHPRTKVSALMSRAHTATRAALKMPRRRRA